MARKNTATPYIQKRLNLLQLMVDYLEVMRKNPSVDHREDVVSLLSRAKKLRITPKGFFVQ